MKFKDTSLSAKVYRAEPFYEKNGQFGMKCTIKMCTRMISRQSNIIYTLQERYVGVHFYGDEEKLVELTNRLRQAEVDWNANRELPFEEQKPLGKAPCVQVVITNIDVVNFWIPKTGMNRFKVYVNDWNFKIRPFKDENHELTKKEELVILKRHYKSLENKYAKLLEKYETLKEKDKIKEKAKKKAKKVEPIIVEQEQPTEIEQQDVVLDIGDSPLF